MGLRNGVEPNVGRGGLVGLAAGVEVGRGVSVGVGGGGVAGAVTVGTRVAVELGIPGSVAVQAVRSASAAADQRQLVIRSVWLESGS